MKEINRIFSFPCTLRLIENCLILINVTQMLRWIVEIRMDYREGVMTVLYRFRRIYRVFHTFYSCGITHATSCEEVFRMKCKLSVQAFRCEMFDSPTALPEWRLTIHTPAFLVAQIEVADLPLNIFRGDIRFIPHLRAGQSC